MDNHRLLLPGPRVLAAPTTTRACDGAHIKMEIGNNAYALSLEYCSRLYAHRLSAPTSQRLRMNPAALSGALTLMPKPTAVSTDKRYAYCQSPFY